MEPEELIYLTNEALAGCIVTDYASEDERYVTTGVYTIASAASEDGEGYDMFLDGAKSLLTIENPASTTDKELIIFRDSFGSSIAPLLVEGCSSVTLVDIRYLASSRLGGFVDFTGCDVLFLYSAGVLNNSSTLK